MLHVVLSCVFVFIFALFLFWSYVFKWGLKPHRLIHINDANYPECARFARFETVVLPLIRLPSSPRSDSVNTSNNNNKNKNRNGTALRERIIGGTEGDTFVDIRVIHEITMDVNANEQQIFLVYGAIPRGYAVRKLFQQIRDNVGSTQLEVWIVDAHYMNQFVCMCVCICIHTVRKINCVMYLYVLPVSYRVARFTIDWSVCTRKRMSIKRGY